MLTLNQAVNALADLERSNHPYTGLLVDAVVDAWATGNSSESAAKTGELAKAFAQKGLRSERARSILKRIDREDE
jgi:hypothetical protein